MEKRKRPSDGFEEDGTSPSKKRTIDQDVTPFDRREMEEKYNQLYVPSPSASHITIGPGEEQFAGFRSAKGDAIVVKSTTLQHVKEFHDRWNKFADEQVKGIVDISQGI